MGLLGLISESPSPPTAADARAHRRGWASGGDPADPVAEGRDDRLRRVRAGLPQDEPGHWRAPRSKAGSDREHQRDPGESPRLGAYKKT